MNNNLTFKSKLDLGKYNEKLTKSKIRDIDNVLTTSFDTDESEPIDTNILKKDLFGNWKLFAFAEFKFKPATYIGPKTGVDLKHYFKYLEVMEVNNTYVNTYLFFSDPFLEKTYFFDLKTYHLVLKFLEENQILNRKQLEYYTAVKESNIKNNKKEDYIYWPLELMYQYTDLDPRLIDQYLLKNSNDLDSYQFGVDKGFYLNLLNKQTSLTEYNPSIFADKIIEYIFNNLKQHYYDLFLIKQELFKSKYFSFKQFKKEQLSHD
jgi:hypothetical protein